MEYVQNVIEIMDSNRSAVKIVLGAVVEMERLNLLSGNITNVDQIILMSLQEEYSTPAVVEFFGRYILAMGKKARRLKPSKEQILRLDVSDKMGYALVGAARALQALAMTAEEVEEKGAAPSVPDAQDFIAHAKQVQKDLEKLGKK